MYQLVSPDYSIRRHHSIYSRLMNPPCLLYRHRPLLDSLSWPQIFKNSQNQQLVRAQSESHRTSPVPSRSPQLYQEHVPDSTAPHYMLRSRVSRFGKCKANQVRRYSYTRTCNMSSKLLRLLQPRRRWGPGNTNNSAPSQYKKSGW